MRQQLGKPWVVIDERKEKGDIRKERGRKGRGREKERERGRERSENKEESRQIEQAELQV